MVAWIFLLYSPVSAVAIEFAFDFGSGFGGEGSEQREALEYAAGLWESWLTNSRPGDANTVEVDVKFVSLSSLATTTAMEWDGHAGGFALTPAEYMMETGSDPKGTDGTIEFRSASSFSNGESWYYGTEGKPGEKQYDFVSISLHEIGHLLGMTVAR